HLKECARDFSPVRESEEISTVRQAGREFGGEIGEAKAGSSGGMVGKMGGGLAEDWRRICLQRDVTCVTLETHRITNGRRNGESMRLILTFENKQGVTVSIPWMGFDVVHTDGRVTLGPTRIDGAVIEIPASRVIRFEYAGC